MTPSFLSLILLHSSVTTQLPKNDLSYF
jgi:hypothetical protein